MRFGGPFPIRAKPRTALPSPPGADTAGTVLHPRSSGLATRSVGGPHRGVDSGRPETADPRGALGTRRDLGDRDHNRSPWTFLGPIGLRVRRTPPGPAGPGPLPILAGDPASK